MGKSLSIPIITLSIYNINQINGYEPISQHEQDEIKAMLPEYLKHLAPYLKKRTKPIRSPAEIDRINQAIFSRQLLMHSPSHSDSSQSTDQSIGTGSTGSQISSPKFTVTSIDSFSFQMQSEIEAVASKYGGKGIAEFGAFFRDLQTCLSTASISPMNALLIDEDVSAMYKARADYKEHHLQYHPLTAILVQTTHKWFNGKLNVRDGIVPDQAVKDKWIAILEAVFFDGLFAEHFNLPIPYEGCKYPFDLPNRREFESADQALMYSLMQASRLILRENSRIGLIYKALWQNAVNQNLVPLDTTMSSYFTTYADVSGYNPMVELYKLTGERHEYNFGWLSVTLVQGNEWNFKTDEDFGECVQILMDSENFKNSKIEYESIKYKLPSLDTIQNKAWLLWKILKNGNYDLTNYGKTGDKKQEEIAVFVKMILMELYQSRDSEWAKQEPYSSYNWAQELVRNKALDSLVIHPKSNTKVMKRFGNVLTGKGDKMVEYYSRQSTAH